jgi:hypothetical protein
MLTLPPSARIYVAVGAAHSLILLVRRSAHAQSFYDAPMRFIAYRDFI